MVFAVRLVPLLTLLSIVGVSGQSEVEIPNVDNLPMVVRERESIESWHARTTASIKEWRKAKETELDVAQAKEMAAFNEHMRSVRCAAMKARLNKDISRTSMAAHAAAQKRREAKEQAEVLRKSREVLQKVSAKGGERSRLAESGDGDSGSKQDAKNWLHAFETSDPSWQRAQRRKMEEREQTDPDWRSHMDNSEGDGGSSWRQHETHLVTAPTQTRGYLPGDTRDETHLDTAPTWTKGYIIGDNFLELEDRLSEQEEPLLQESAVLAIENLGKPVVSEAAATAEAALFGQQSQEKAWMLAQTKAHTDAKASGNADVKKLEEDSMKAQSAIITQSNKLAKCGDQRNSMHKLIADTIVSLPDDMPEEEKIADEKPLLESMEAWLKCELCKK